MQISNKDIENEKIEVLIFDEGIEEGINRFELCMVGNFLTEKSINVRIMKTKMTDIWRPVVGITVKDFNPGLILF